MIKFDEHIGEQIFICPKHPLTEGGREGQVYNVKLVGADSGGIWFEHQEATQGMLQWMKSRGLQPPSDFPKVLAFFLPYSEIYFAFVVATTIDERSLGV